MTTLIFAGDTAWPRGCSLKIDEIEFSFGGTPVIANLEGPILTVDPSEAEVRSKLKFNLYSDISLLRKAKELGIIAFGVSNNHSDDYHGGLKNTQALLAKEGIQVFGTQYDQTAVIEQDSTVFRIIGACSPLTDIGRRNARESIAAFDPHALLRAVRTDRSKYPSARIVVYVHWGYELASFPLPADREWARKAIDAGADYVIGHHPHVVQGIERYRNGLIAYSVGNFILPQARYRDRVLRYDDENVKLQLAISIGKTEELFWFRYDVPDERIRFLERSSIDEDRRIQSVTPFSGMGDSEYAKWYRKKLRSGSIRRRVGQPVLWTYFGFGQATYVGKTALFNARQALRKLAIVAGVHRPHNW